MPKRGSGVCCAVAVCKNTYYKSKKLNKEISYHHFTADKTIRKLWVNSCTRKDSFNPNTSYICSEHFARRDFERIKKQEYIKKGRCAKKELIQKNVIQLRRPQGLGENLWIVPQSSKNAQKNQKCHTMN